MIRPGNIWSRHSHKAESGNYLEPETRNMKDFQGIDRIILATLFEAR